MPQSHQSPLTPNYSSCNQSGSGGGVVLEGRRNLLLRLIVTSKTMNARLDQDETEFGVLVFAVDLKVLAHGHRLFDEVPEVLWDGRCQSLRLKDTEDLVTSDEAHLGDPVRVTEGNTDLGGSKTLASQFDDVVDDFIGRGLEPRRRGALVGKSRGRNALAGSVHTTHDE